MRAKHDSADGGDEQDDRRDLEREQVVGEEEAADRLGRAEAAPDVARVPEKIYKPNTKANLLLGLVAGLSLGATLAFLIEYFDTSLRTPDQVEKLVGHPVIGIVPVFAAKR